MFLPMANFPSRAVFLSGLSAAAGALALPAAAESWVVAPAPRALYVRRLQVHGPEDVFEGVWFDRVVDPQTGVMGWGVVPQAYEALCRLGRDLSGYAPPGRQTVAIAPLLLQVLWEIQQAHLRAGWIRRGSAGEALPPWLVSHSCYRCAAFNAALAPEGAASNSQHVHGDAMDYHVEGVPLSVTAKLAKNAPWRGGYGYYPYGNVNAPAHGLGWIHTDVRGQKADWTG
jgi:uncharacterized protein YcbK (DUF882 family)